ncbi:hypothetical protein AUK40_06225 [Candidatus Wirthbacteria bacterium CG2_30_54_11]|uniref:mannose-1-phosphate guanylyltransferase n=1 Tax=Candidatus Wirthbacteria bacterium CG2_30_54_11 TaxID=1817892 RepID=A0A1J5IPV6_9BACT|nr:MAG: hypothetical protein AUK40_06225 [Candidatus Wirthbacteria bacterium CG2_30_54_11]
MYAIIPAGGSGSRLWPVSRSHFPKHLLNLTGHGSMIQETVKRILSLIPLEHIFVVTAQSHTDQIAEQLPALPPANIITEPDRRDTAPVIGLGACYVRARDSKAILASLHADHVIQKGKEFIKLLKVAETIASRHDVIVTLGIQPTHPATGYGYISSGDSFACIHDQEIFKVKAFTEKPNLPTAHAFLAAGNYFWNAGIFIARAEVLLEAYRLHAPKLYEPLMRIAAAIGTRDEQSTIRALYPTLPKEPIDTAIMEKAHNIVVIPSDIGWDDIGSWKTVKTILPANKGSNFVFGQHEGVDTENSLIYSSSDRLIATIGLQNMIVIDTEDATLICPMDRAEEVKQLVDKLKKDKRDSYL